MPLTIAAGIGALHPVNVDNREHSMRVLNLALMLADDAARDDVEEYCAIAEEGGVLWCDTSRAPPDMIHPQDQAYCRSRVSRALRYVDLRDTDVAPWIFHRHPERAHLVRFETRR